jgi:hypothetical protein
MREDGDGVRKRWGDKESGSLDGQELPRYRSQVVTGTGWQISAQGTR